MLDPKLMSEGNQSLNPPTTVTATTSAVKCIKLDLGDRPRTSKNQEAKTSHTDFNFKSDIKEES